MRLIIEGALQTPVFHDAPCVPLSGSTYRCECPRGLQGYFCEINIDDCVNNECQHWSTCEDLIGILSNYLSVLVLCTIPNGIGHLNILSFHSLQKAPFPPNISPKTSNKPFPFALLIIKSNMFQTGTRAPVFRVTVDDSARVSLTPVLNVLVSITVTAATSDFAGTKISRSVLETFSLVNLV